MDQFLNFSPKEGVSTRPAALLSPVVVQSAEKGGRGKSTDELDPQVQLALWNSSVEEISVPNTYFEICILFPLCPLCAHT